MRKKCEIDLKPEKCDGNAKYHPKPNDHHETHPANASRSVQCVRSGLGSLSLKQLGMDSGGGGARQRDKAFTKWQYLTSQPSIESPPPWERDCFQVQFIRSNTAEQYTRASKREEERRDLSEFMGIILIILVTLTHPLV